MNKDDEIDFVLKMMKNLSVDTANGKHLKRLAKIYGIDLPVEDAEGEWITILTDYEIRKIILEKITGLSSNG